MSRLPITCMRSSIIDPITHEIRPYDPDRDREYVQKRLRAGIIQSYLKHHPNAFESVTCDDVTYYPPK